MYSLVIHYLEITVKRRFCCLFLLISSLPSAAEPDAARHASTIDRLVNVRLAKLGQQANPPIDDSAWLRRVSLMAIGRIPTADEYRAFHSDTTDDRRSQVIDRLLASPGYAKHHANIWGDVFRAKTRMTGQGAGGYHGGVFIDWIEDSLAADLPYDQWVYQMLSAQGGLWAPGGGARGYLMRDFKMPLDNMSNSMQVFLATRMACAQCHDDPNSKWTQSDFYKLAAFFNGMQYSMAESAPKMRATYHVEPYLGKVTKTIGLSIQPGIDGEGIGHIRLPFDYQYDDGEPGEIVKADVPFGPPAPLAYEEIEMIGWHTNHAKVLSKIKYGHRPVAPKYAPNASRAAFAKWVTHPENERFAWALANRVWKQTMGMGLVEPVDHIRKPEDASDPALLQALAQIIHACDFKLKTIYKVLYSTDIFARAPMADDMVFSKDMGFAGPALQRMSAEQMWDSLMVLRSPQTDRMDGGQVNAGNVQIWQKYAPLETDAMLAEAKRVAAAAKVQGFKNPIQHVYADAKASGPVADETAMASKGPKPDRSSLRASEMHAPAPSRHFLYNFGQSQKEMIDASERRATVPQALALMNGLESVLLNPRAGLLKTLHNKTAAEALDELFIAVLTRPPTDTERQMFTEILAQDAEAARVDVLWILLNTHEFRFIP
jgi:hypothetical protein